MATMLAMERDLSRLIYDSLFKGIVDKMGFGNLSCGSPRVIVIAQRYRKKRALIMTNDDGDVCRHGAIFIFNF